MNPYLASTLPKGGRAIAIFPYCFLVFCFLIFLAFPKWHALSNVRRFREQYCGCPVTSAGEWFGRQECHPGGQVDDNLFLIRSRAPGSNVMFSLFE